MTSGLITSVGSRGRVASQTGYQQTNLFGQQLKGPFRQELVFRSSRIRTFIAAVLRQNPMLHPEVAECRL